MLSLEGDAAGRAFRDVLLSNPQIDRRVIADRYSDHILGDKILWTPSSLLDEKIQNLRKSTVQLRNDLQNQNIAMKLVNPLGPLFYKMPSREHRKYYIVDDTIAYIGGINVSDHNFAWHDMMVRIDDPEIVRILHFDFLESWNDRRTGGAFRTPDNEVLIFDGLNNAVLSQKIIDLIDLARKSIFLQAPYVSFPYFEPLKRAARRGVAVQVVTPRKNNWGLNDGYIRREMRGSGIEHLLYPGMTHMKSLFIDENCLVTGSANFEYFSARLHREVVLVSRDASLIEQFKNKIVAPDTRISASRKESARRAGDDVAYHLFTWLHKGMERLNRP